MRIIKSDGPFTIQLDLYPVGQDLLAVLQGGAAHLGCAVLAVPRPSLNEPGKRSCTSSVLNQVGHKDEGPCRQIAEALCVHSGKVTVCAGGLHWDGITSQQLRQVSQLMEEIVSEVVSTCLPQ